MEDAFVSGRARGVVSEARPDPPMATPLFSCASDLIPASALPFGKVLYFSMVQLLLIRLSSMRKLLVWDSGEMVLSAQCSAGLPTPTHGRRNVGRGGEF